MVESYKDQKIRLPSISALLSSSYQSGLQRKHEPPHKYMFHSHENSPRSLSSRYDYPPTSTHSSMMYGQHLPPPPPPVPSPPIYPLHSYTYYQHPQSQHTPPPLHHPPTPFPSPSATSCETSPSSSPILYHQLPHHRSGRSVKPKRKRATADQIHRLNQVFDKTFFPTSDQRILLAQELGMTPRTVQIWFQNKRQGWRSEHRRPVPRATVEAVIEFK